MDSFFVDVIIGYIETRTQSMELNVISLMSSLKKRMDAILFLGNEDVIVELISGRDRSNGRADAMK